MNYELIEFVARGGMARVWRATDLRTGSTVALKFVADADDDRTNSLFLEEAQRHAGLRHPAIAQIFDVGRMSVEGRDDVPFIAMEWAAGGTLRQNLPRSWPQLRHTALQILDGLAYAHAADVVHRDLKPDNVVVTEDDSGERRLKLADFGIAHLIDPVRAAEEDLGAFAGTPVYMPPEQIRGRWRDFGPWTDLYALGCMLFELSSGRPPFDGPDVMSIALQHAEERPPPLTPRFPVPDGFEAWLEWLMQKEPRRRPERAADAAWNLLQLEEPEPQGSVEDASAQRGPVVSTWDAMGLLDTLVQEGCPHASTTFEHSADPFEHAPAAGSWRSPPDVEELPAHPSVFRLREMPFVGREDAIDLLWQRTIDLKGPRVSVLTGPAGLGKTRLAEFVGRRASELGVARFWQTSHPRHDAILGGPRRLLLNVSRAWGLPHGETKTRFGALGVDEATADQLASIVVPQGEESTPHSRRDVMTAFGEFVTRHSNRPVVVLLDDVHHSRDSVECVEHVVENHPKANVHFILTVDAAGDHPDSWTQLGLQPLDPAQTDELIERAVLLGPSAREQALRACDGDPLFLFHLLGSWLEDLEWESDGYALSAMDVPDSTAELIEESLQRVFEGIERPAEARAITTAAALLSSTVLDHEWNALARIDGADDGWAARLLERLMQAGLARRVLGGWAFTNPFIQRVVTEREDTAEAHSQCARVLEELHDTTANQIAARHAHHLTQAGELDDAIDALRAAARNARHRGDYEDGRDLVTQRATLLDQVADPSDPRYAAGWWEMIPYHFIKGDPAKARAFAQRVLASPATELWARTWVLLGMIELENPETALEHFLAAKRVVDASNDPNTATEIDYFLGVLWTSTGDFDDAIRALESSYKNGRRARFRRMSCSQLASVYGTLGRIDDARDWIEKGRDELEKTLTDPVGDADFVHKEGMVCLLEGNTDLAVEKFRHALELWSRSGVAIDRRSALVNLALTYITRGEFEMAREQLDRADELSALHPEIERDFRFADLVVQAALDGEVSETKLKRLESRIKATSVPFLFGELLRSADLDDDVRRQLLESIDITRTRRS